MKLSDYINLQQTKGRYTFAEKEAQKTLSVSIANKANNL
jgi:hypothetical protein